MPEKNAVPRSICKSKVDADYEYFFESVVLTAELSYWAITGV